jgi:thiamine-phosphate pyrophosphorylase
LSDATRATARDRLRGLHVLADDAPHWKCDPPEQARAACRGGAAVVQLRTKFVSDRDMLSWAAEIRAATREAGVLFLVNNRFDLALLADADGVHLGQEDLPPSWLPAQARERLLVGRSTHTLAQARAACDEPIDYVAFGPVFGTTSKRSEYAARGVPMLREIARIVAPRALIAIGGIEAARIPELLRTGIAGVAVISAVAAATDPEAATRELTRLLEQTGARGAVGP